jgi:hypothetical protein
MKYNALEYPVGVVAEGEDECPEAIALIAVLIGRLEAVGPSPEEYNVKNLGKKQDGLWQINMKIEGRQVRVLYAPYDRNIVLFCIHKKSSPQEQTRGYTTAKRRKAEYEKHLKAARGSHGGNRTLH